MIPTKATAPRSTLHALAALLVLASGAIAQETLLFDPSGTPGVTYRLRWGTNTGGVQSTMELGTNRIINLANGPWGRLFFTVVAVITNTESAPSNELLLTNRPAAPLVLRALEYSDGLILQGTTNGGLAWRYLAYITNRAVSFTVSDSAMMFRTVRGAPPPTPMPAGALFTAAAAEPAPYAERVGRRLKPHRQRGMQ